MARHVHAMVLCAGLVLPVLAGCTAGDPSETTEEEVQTARLPQLDPDVHDWLTIKFETANEPLFDILVIGANDVGRFTRNTEYWYVHSAGLDLLGEGKDLEVSIVTEGEGPPDLSGDQEFTQPVYLTWQSFTTDPVSEGVLYGDTEDRYLRIKAESGEITRVVWYQALTSQTPANIALKEGTFAPAGSSVPVGSGQYGYYIDATIE